MPGRVPARLLGALGWALTAALVGVLVWFGWPSTLGGCTTLTIVSGHSMEPTYYTGDLVVSRCGVPAEGDVVVYSPPDSTNGRIIHRVVGGDAVDGWIIQGDNNDFLDPWRPHQADVLGIGRLHLPGVGKIASILLDPWAWASLVVLAGGLLLWPSRPETAAAAGDADADGADAAVAQPVVPDPALPGLAAVGALAVAASATAASVAVAAAAAAGAAPADETRADPRPAVPA